MSQSTKRRPRWLLALAVPLGLVASGVLVYQASYAAFTASTTSDANTFSTGNVVLDQTPVSGSTVFNATNLGPTDTGFDCISAQYSGSLAASIKLYTAYELDGGSNPISGLAPYLDVVVDEVDTAGACPASGSLVGDNNLYTGTLSGLVSANDSYANGLLTWTPAANAVAETRRYRIRYTVQDNNSAQAQSASVRLTFEARST